MMASVAKDIGAQYFENMEDGDDGSFEQVHPALLFCLWHQYEDWFVDTFRESQVIINGEEALTTLEQLIANQWAVLGCERNFVLSSANDSR